MPPLVYETVAWLRFYTWIPFPRLPGEDIAVAPDPVRNGYAAPLAGAVIGLAAGIVTVIAAALGASGFVAAAAGVIALTVIGGGRAEYALLNAADRQAAPPADANLLRYGAALLVFFAIARVGALEGLAWYGVWHAAFALVAACAVGRAAAIGFTLLRPTSGEGAPAPSALQWLAISGLGIGVVAGALFFGLGAAVAGIAAAAGAVALVSAFLPRTGGDADRDFVAIAELTAETAFLIAALAFASA